MARKKRSKKKKHRRSSTTKQSQQHIDRDNRADVKAKAARLSICMIVRNEEETLPDCLENIRGLPDELIIVDTGSTDRTVAIAEQFGARVFHFEWVDDFSAARNESIRHATGDWILWLDADDRLEPKYHRSVRQLMHQPKDRSFTFVLENVGADDATCAQVRMFPNLPGIEFTMPVHEQVTPSLIQLGIAKIAQTDVVITHTGYTDPETIYHKKQKYLQIMERWLEDHPEDYVTRSHIALTYHTAGHPDAAIAEYRRIIYESPCKDENPYMYRYALLFLGRSYMQLGDYETALAIFNEAKQEDSELTLVSLSLGECYHYLDRPEEAVQHLQYVCDHPMQRTYFPMELSTIHYAAHHFLAMNLEKLHRLTESIQEYRAAIKVAPKKLEAWLGLAKLYHERGEWAQATDLLLQSLTHEVEHADIYHLLGIGFLQMQKPQEALVYFQGALRLQPDHSGAGNNLGLAFYRLGRLEDARQVYITALEISPNNLDAAVNLAHLHLELGEFEQAQRRFGQVISMAPGSLDVNLGFAWASAELGQADQVRFAWEEIVRSDELQQTHGGFEKAHHSSVSADGLARLAATLHEQGRPQLAEYAIRTAIALQPSSLFWEQLGDLCHAMQRPEDALESYEQALLMEPQRKQLFLKLGECYTALGVTEAAEMCQEQAA